MITSMARALSHKTRAILSVIVMILGAVAVYCPWSVLTGQKALMGVDYVEMHEWRIPFA
jgi:hypothetical protein